jgi:hypothetical protein
MSRKTVDIKFLKEKANSFLLNSEDDMIGERIGIYSLLEAALFETNNYKGFNYLPSEFEKTGELLPALYLDETRRKYY